ncbi:hypothetical protein GO986_20735 [Deinococcus sp. HMF7620]|uniref:HTH iclR-type domain-containing protein n=1 Tax=Deinococcus arboris TaxID=2682977 RepID=A0A7C9IF51_9DEIO|nr:hypothetical protein [Deinococcus arboris]
MRQTQNLLRVLRHLSQVEGEHYSYGLSVATGLSAPTAYYILNQLVAAGYATQHWETENALDSSKPPRQLFRLTAAGRQYAASRPTPAPQVAGGDLDTAGVAPLPAVREEAQRGPSGTQSASLTRSKQQSLNLVQAVLAHPHAYTAYGSYYEVIAFIEGYHAGPRPTETRWVEFQSWLQTRVGQGQGQVLVQFRQGRQNDGRALQDLKALYSAFLACPAAS